MTGSSVSPSHEAGRRVAPKQLESDGGGATVQRDHRTLRQTNTLLERGVDLERLREDRVRKVQAEMRARDVGVGDTRLGVDCLDYHGFSALQGLGVRLTDADDPVEAARVIKTTDEVELLKQSAAICEAALYDLAEAIRPGANEHEILGVSYHKMLSLGGEYCFAHLYFISMTMSKIYWTRVVGSVSVLPTIVDRRPWGSREEGKTASDASGSIIEVLPIFTDQSMPIAVFVERERLKSLIVCGLLIGGLSAGATIKRFDIEK
jgi:hypothetical protein